MPRLVRFDRLGGSDVLHTVEEPIREPGLREVRIRVEAIGLNRAENLYRAGYYMYQPHSYPSGIGYEVAGVVDAVGPGVEHLKVGDRVATVPAFSQADYALYGEVVIAPTHAVVPAAPHLSAEENASVWMQYVTAYGALVAIAGLRPGDTLLATAATGGLGVASIQIAKRVGAKVVATTRKPEKRAYLESLGPDRVVVTTEEDLLAAVRDVSGPVGPRVILDAVMGPTLPELANLVAPAGIIVAYGALHAESVSGTPYPLPVMIGKGVTLRGYTLFELTYDPARFGTERPFDPERYPAAIRFVESGLADGSLKPIIAASYPFDRIVEAHAAVEQGAQAGKIIVTVGAKGAAS
ncbi:MAG TPA: zinc-dependent alcohol dehydrogenase family protein [Rariglobus sp.]